MIQLTDLEEAIAECQGQRNPTAQTCIKLAAFYTIRNEMFGEQKPQVEYSYAPAKQSDTITIDSGSDFARIVNGLKMDDVMPIIDELMTVLQVTNQRLYNSVIQKLED